MNLQTFIISFGLFFVATIVYAYFTCWCYLDVRYNKNNNFNLIIQPFLDKSNPNKKYFSYLPRTFIYIIPGIIFIGIITVGFLLRHSAKKLKIKKNPLSDKKKVQ